MKLTILGCHAATPRTSANPSAQVLEVRNHMFLIDCGEGTQVQLRRNKVKFGQITQVFISHLHGDHCFGLIGLIATFSMLKRDKPLTIHGPVGIKEFILFQLKLTNSWTNYPLSFNEISATDATIIFEDERVLVTTIPLHHRVYCNGYLFQEKPGDRKLLIEEAIARNIPIAYYKSLKKGKNITLDSGVTVENSSVTAAPTAAGSYAYCSDTKYQEDKVKQLQNITLLYHESTFLEKQKHLAAPTGHSTAMEAALIAKKANVTSLLLGHYSTRYRDLELFLEEAKTIFPAVELAEDGKVIDF